MVPFILGAFAIIVNEQGHVLLGHRRDMDLWNLPGGGVESGELPTEAVVREVLEETGLEVVVERLVGVYRKLSQDELVFAFTCRVVGGELYETEETDVCQYFPVDEMPVNLVPKHVERIRDALIDQPPVFRVQVSPSGKEWLAGLHR